MLSRVLFFLRKPREGIELAGVASHVARQIGGDRVGVELVQADRRQATGDRVEAGLAGVSSKGIAPQGGWMFGAVAGASGQLGGPLNLSSGKWSMVGWKMRSKGNGSGGEKNEEREVPEPCTVQLQCKYSLQCMHSSYSYVLSAQLQLPL